MSINKTCAPKFAFLNEKKNQKDLADFSHRKMTFENQNCATFNLPLQIDPNA